MPYEPITTSAVPKTGYTPIISAPAATSGYQPIAKAFPTAPVKTETQTSTPALASPFHPSTAEFIDNLTARPQEGSKQAQSALGQFPSAFIETLLPAVKAIRDNPELASHITGLDLAKATPKALLDAAKSIPVGVLSGATELPNIATGGLYQPQIKFNLPVLGEVSNSDYKIAQRVANGDDPLSAVVGEKSTGLLNALFFLSLAAKPFQARQSVVATGVKGNELPSGSEIPGAKSFRLQEPIQGKATPIANTTLDTLKADGVDLKNYDPKYPSFFRTTEMPNGQLKGEIVQVKPSYFEAFKDKIFKGDISDVPKENTISVYEKLTTPEGIKSGINGLVQKYQEVPGKQGGYIKNPTADQYPGEKDLTSSVLDRLEGKTSVSKQYISDLTNSADMKQAERDMVRKVLEQYPDGSNVPVKDFAEKVKEGLLPLNTQDYADRSKYESVTLPEEIRGNVANYDEHIYESPIKTSAGSIHYGDYGARSDEKPLTPQNYFAHSRTEDMADGNTRRVIEVQSDLFQKGRLEDEAKKIAEKIRPEGLLEKYFTPGRIVKGYGGFDKVLSFNWNDGHWNVEVQSVNADGTPNKRDTRIRNHATYPDSAEINKFIVENKDKLFKKEWNEQAGGIQKLDPYRNTWQDRIISEEIKQAAVDGKTKVQFPTGETAMKIEGLGSHDSFVEAAGSVTDNPITPEELEVGKALVERRTGKAWTIIKVLDDGRFEAVPKRIYDDSVNGKVKSDTTGYESNLESYKETFDISNRVNTNDPIYKFYEKEVARFLKNKYGAKLITDDKGVTWNEVPITPDLAKKPVSAFGGAGLNVERRQSPFAGIAGKKGGFAKNPLADKSQTGSDAPVSKDLEPLAEEARKYKSAEEYKNQLEKTIAHADSQLGGSHEYEPSTAKIYQIVADNIPTEPDQLTKIENIKNDIKAGKGMPPIVVDMRTGDTKTPFELVDGNHRLQAYKELGIKEIPILKIGMETTKGSIKGISDITSFYNQAKGTIGGSNEAPSGQKSAKVVGTATQGDTPITIKKGGAIEGLKTPEVPVEKMDPTAKVKNLHPNPVEKKLERLLTERDAHTEALDNNPARGLLKYVSPSTGRLPEVTGKDTMKSVSGSGKTTSTSNFGLNGDDILTEHGFADTESAQLAIDNYYLQRKRVEDINERIAQTRKEVTISKSEGKDAKSLASFLERAAKKTDKQISEMEKNLNRPETAEQLRVRKENARDRMIEILKRTYGAYSVLERETPAWMLQLSESAYNMTPEEHEQMLEDTSFRHMIDVDTSTPVSRKVRMIDYLRTPDRVLNRIGLGEVAKDLRTGYNNYLAELPVHLKVIEDWKKRAPSAESNKLIFRYLDQGKAFLRTFDKGKGTWQKINLTKQELKVAREIREYLREWADRLGLPADNKITHYITHIFGLRETEKEFDEDMVKIIRDKVPGSVYDPFLEKRLGKKGYIEDTWKSLEAYVKRAARKANMDFPLEKLKDAAESLEDSQQKYVQRYASQVNMRPTELDNLTDNMFKDVFGYRFGPRPTAVISRFLRQMVYRQMLGLNHTTALKNLTQGVNTFTKLGPKYTLTGYTKLMTQAGSSELKDAGILSEDIIQDKVSSVVHRGLEKMDKVLFSMMKATEYINRGAAYYGAKAKALDQGKDEFEAMEYAKKMARDTQFNYGSIDTPLAMRGDLVKLFTQFMSYPVKQAEFAAELIQNKDWQGIIRYVISAAVLVYTIGNVLGLKARDFVPGSAFYPKQGFGGQSRFGSAPSLSLLGSVTAALAGAPGSFSPKGGPRGGKSPLEKTALDVAKNIPIPAGLEFQKLSKFFQQKTSPKKKTGLAF